MTKIITHPFIINIGMLLFSYLLYDTEITNNFPELTVSMLFLLLTVTIVAGVGFFLTKSKWLMCLNSDTGFQLDVMVNWLFGTVILLLVVDIISDQGLPFLAILRGNQISKQQVLDYGVPIVHPLLVIGCQVLAVVGYECRAQSEKKTRYSIVIVIAFVIMLLFFNRGAMMITMSALLFVALTKNHIRNARRLITIGITLVFSITLFGFLGDMRTADEDLLRTAAGVDNQTYQKLIVPQLWWAYVYLTSSVANLQLAINYSNDPDIDSLIKLAKYEICFDVVSKRIFSREEIPLPPLVNLNLTTSTMLGQGYYISGFLGALIVFLWWSFFIAINILLMRSSGGLNHTVAAFCFAGALLTTFCNMTVFSGIAGPIVISNIINRFGFGIHPK